MFYTIPAARKKAVEFRIFKLAKKAKKYGNEDINITFSDPYFSEMKDVHGIERTVELVDVEVTGEAPVYQEGWSLIARVELLGDENLVHEVPTKSVEIDGRFRTHNGNCEHCKKLRKRNDVYVFDNGEEQIAVGRQCLRDFIGADDPKAIVSRAQFFESVKRDIDEECEGFAKSAIYVEDALALTSAFIRKDGWVSKAKMRDTGTISTADCVLNSMNHVKGYDMKVDDEDMDLAEEVVARFRNSKGEENNYMENLRVLIKQDMVQEKNLGLLCSAVSVLIEEKTVKAESESSRSEYVGEIKQRIRGLGVTVSKEIYLGTSEFGERYVYNFVTREDDVLVWFTGKKDVSVGDEVNLDFTVKDHNEYRGIKQTVVTRAKIK